MKVGGLVLSKYFPEHPSLLTPRHPGMARKPERTSNKIIIILFDIRNG
jgi:hypothetical protein